jgi:hypothetical protein
LGKSCCRRPLRTSAGPVNLDPGTEAEYLDGKVYVWRGGFEGGAINGSDSWLLAYDVTTDGWSQTPSLQDAGVVPGFRTGAFDVWGVSLTADSGRHLLCLTGGERNRQLYLFDPVSQTWAAGAEVATLFDGRVKGG